MYKESNTITIAISYNLFRRFSSSTLDKRLGCCKEIFRLVSDIGCNGIICFLIVCTVKMPTGCLNANQA